MAQPNDVLILTKPLGTQLGSQTWLSLTNENVQVPGCTSEHIQRAYQNTIHSMVQLNRSAAQLMHKYNAHAATDITGFGLLGHATNLLQFQQLNGQIDFRLHTLPIIGGVRDIAVALNRPKLLKGQAVETSGGLLVVLSEADAGHYCAEFKQITGRTAWIIGCVVERVNGGRADGESGTVFVDAVPKFIDDDDFLL